MFTMPHIDPLTVLLIAIIVGSVLFLIGTAIRRWWRIWQERRNLYVGFFWNDQEWLLPSVVYREIIDALLPEGQHIVEQATIAYIQGQPISDRERQQADFYLADALNRTMFANPNSAKYFTPEVQAAMRRRQDHSRGR